MTYQGHAKGSGYVRAWRHQRIAGGVRGAIELHDGSLLSWSWDSTLRHWCRETGDCLGVYRNHGAYLVGAQELWDGSVLSWSDDGMLRRWCLGSSRPGPGNTTSHAEILGGLALRDGTVVVWAADSCIDRYHPRTGDYENIVAGRPFCTKDIVETESEILVCRDETGQLVAMRQDGTFVSNLDTSLDGRLRGLYHEEWLHSLQDLRSGAGGTVLAEDAGGVVHVWDPATGRHLEALPRRYALGIHPNPDLDSPWRMSGGSAIRLELEGREGVVEWHGSGLWRPVALMPSGILVAISGSRVKFLQLCSGTRQMDLAEAERLWPAAD